MAVGSALQAGYLGLQRGLRDAQTAAETIAQPNLEAGAGELTEALVDLLQAEIQVKASAEVVDSAQESIGTLIDVFA